MESLTIRENELSDRARKSQALSTLIRARAAEDNRESLTVNRLINQSRSRSVRRMRGPKELRRRVVESTDALSEFTEKLRIARRARRGALLYTYAAT